MKVKAALTILALLSMSHLAQAQKEGGFASFVIGGWDMQLVSKEKIYPTYLADPLEVRFDLSNQNMLFSSIDNHDKVNKVGTYLDKVAVKPAARISLLRFSPANKPKLGIELDLGMALPFTMRHTNHDLIALDGIFYWGICGAPTEWLRLRLAKHHICTHRGIEFWAGSVDSPIDFDPQMYNFYVRDDFVLSAAIKPFYFLGIPELDILQLYGDFYFYIPGEGKLGPRQNKPNSESYYIFQGGAELEYYFRKSFLGGVFAALNVSAWQENGYSPNYSFTAGYIFPQAPDKRRFRLGLNYYDGRCLNNEFFNYSERFLALQLSFDM